MCAVPAWLHATFKRKGWMGCSGGKNQRRKDIVKTIAFENKTEGTIG